MPDSEITTRLTGRLSPCCGSVVREEKTKNVIVNELTKRRKQRTDKTYFCNNCERTVI